MQKQIGNSKKWNKVKQNKRWKGQCPFALLQHTEKFWNIFFQTFQAGMLFFSGASWNALLQNKRDTQRSWTGQDTVGYFLFYVNV